MIPKEKQAAQLLEGKELADGWKVIKKIDLQPYNTGGAYSCCYEVTNGTNKGFLKAFDFSPASKAGGGDQIRNILNAFNIEKEILEECNKYKFRNIIQLISYGELIVSEAEIYPNVYYLIIEYAEKGDVRDAIEEKRATIEWKLRSLHQLALGLKQLHSILIAHQDIKPSNIVTMSNDVTKLTDFGSAIPLMHNNKELPPHLLKPYVGTWEYAPPELLYGYLDSDETTRRIGCDLYLLGSMVAFYFTNMSMTSLIKLNLEDSFCWTNPLLFGQYDQIKSYLIMAFEKALDDIHYKLEEDEIKEKIIMIIRYLCNPDPKKRGHPKYFREIGSNYNLERFVSMFNELATYFELKKGIIYKKRWA
jgi:eukaryotic-like serine/threonine-protein kinase